MAKLITYWVIRNKFTRRILATPQSTGHGSSNTHVDLKDEGIPRLFVDESTAKRCLAQWLQGVHKNHWEDGLEVHAPLIPRVKEDMEVVPVELKVMA